VVHCPEKQRIFLLKIEGYDEIILVEEVQIQDRLVYQIDCDPMNEKGYLVSTQ
jgi:hypothetical protein